MISQQLKEMSRAEKLIAMEEVWDDLTHDVTEFVSPGWHHEELLATEQRANLGKEHPIDWERAKKRLRDGQ